MEKQADPVPFPVRSTLLHSLVWPTQIGGREWEESSFESLGNDVGPEVSLWGPYSWKGPKEIAPEAVFAEQAQNFYLMYVFESAWWAKT